MIFGLPFVIPAVLSTVMDFAKSKNGALIIGVTLVAGWLYWGHLTAVSKARVAGAKAVIEESNKAGAKNNAESAKARADALRGNPFDRLCKRGDCRAGG